MFQRIGYRIALQFMAFVFLLLLINGALFLIADFGNARRQLHMRLTRTTQLLTSQTQLPLSALPLTLPPPLRERLRIVDHEGNTVYTGMLFSDVAFSPQPEFDTAIIQNDQYGVLTTPIRREGQVIGYVQIVDAEHLPFWGLPRRAAIYVLVSVLLSVLTFAVGLFFARRSLRPAEQMMERLQQFTQDASHELRTPLAVLNSSLDLALKTGKHREGIESAKEDVHRVSVLVERLLELARLDTFILQSEPLDLSALVEESVERHRSLAEEKHITLASTLKPDITVRGDPALIRQILSNLLINAIKFSKPAGGTVRVQLTKDKLSIEDEGIGIAPALLPHIFDRFYQVDGSRSEGGFGLGLALVKRIVDVHGWTISAKSQPGKGSVFVLSFS